MSNIQILEGHPQWPEVIKICQSLKDKGFKAWLAGGCVRDMILGVVPQDFDVVTDALPEEVQKIFPDSLDIGKAFGIIMIPVQDYRIEVATFRSDGIYKDGRRPTSVTFATAEEDAQRRDFTVNAMFYDPFEKKVQDFVEGQRDLQKKLLRAVGAPLKRFQEDKLRMLRAVRFSAQLDFQIEDQTLRAIQAMASEIDVISKERIFYEMNRLMQTKKSAEGIQNTKNLGLLEAIFQNSLEINAVPRLVKVLRENEILDVDIKWMLFWKILIKEDEQVQRIKSFMFVKGFLKIFNYVTDALRKIDLGVSNGEGYELAFDPLFNYVLQVGRLTQDKKFQEKLGALTQLQKDFSALPEPLIDGHDLQGLGLKPSRQMKELLKKCFYHQLENKIKDKGVLLLWAKDQFS